MLGRRSRENITTLLFSKMNHFFLQPRPTHQQEIFNSKDVAAQDRRPDLLYPKALATPWRTGSRDNVIASDWWQLLRQHLGLAIGKVSVAGYDGSFWNHDAGTCVLKVGMDRNFITWQCERGKRMLSTENDFSSVHLPNPRSRLIRLLFSALGFFFLPSQNPLLSIRADTDTRPSGMNMQETFFSFLADTGSYVEWVGERCFENF